MRACSAANNTNVAGEDPNLRGKTWAGTRARVQRLSDGRLFGGWILREVDGGLSISLSSHALEVGDLCSIQSFGWHSRVTRGTCILVSDDEASFRLEGQEIVRASSFEPRVNSQNLMAMLRSGDALIPAEVQDVSPNGLSLTTEKCLQKGDSVLINIRLGDRVLRISGQVANIRANSGNFRLGIKIVGMSEADHALWQTMFEKIA